MYATSQVSPLEASISLAKISLKRLSAEFIFSV